MFVGNSNINEEVEENIVEKKITSIYFGYLVGRIKETLEASVSDERQLRALKSVVTDRMYDWWRGAGEGSQPLQPTEVVYSDDRMVHSRSTSLPHKPSITNK